MTKFYSLAFLCLFAAKVVCGQLAYSFSASQGTYTPINGGTVATLVLAQTPYDIHDEGYSNNLPIGFSFTYNNRTYTTISANTNGFASFQTLGPITDPNNDDYYTADLGFGPLKANTRPVLAPLWDDLDLFSDADIKYITTGTAPLREFTLQWSNVYWDVTAVNVNIEFQLKLYETTNIIEFRYRQLPGAVGTAPGAAIGITGASQGDGNYLSLNNASANPVASSTVNTYTITTRPTTGQIYRFTPQGTLPVTLIDFSADKKDGTHVLHWSTAQEVNNNGFEVERSADAVNFTSIAFVSSKAPDENSSSLTRYSAQDKRPLAGNNYYRLKQLDKDGRSTYSKVILLRGEMLRGFSLGALYPNPAKSSVRLVVSTDKSGEINLRVTDFAGRTVVDKKMPVVNGDNVIPLNVSMLANGIYAVEVCGESGSAVAQFVKN